MFAVPARVSRAASNVAWSLSTHFNAILPEGELPNPSWAPCRLLKSWERTQMTVGCPEENTFAMPRLQYRSIRRGGKRSSYYR